MLLKKIKNQGIDEEDEIMGNFIIYGAGERGKWTIVLLPFVTGNMKNTEI